MASFDSFANVDEWISDYYLTNDEPKGESFGKRAAATVARWKKEDKESHSSTSPWARFTAHRNELHTALATIDPASPSSLDLADAAIATAFGYPAARPLTLGHGNATLSLDATAAHQAMILRLTPITSIEDLPDARLRGDLNRDGADPDWSAMKLVTELFLTDTPPAFIVLLAGAWVILAERDSWPLGRHLAFNVALAVERNDTKAKGELQQVVAALAWENIAQAADGTTWWLDTLTESRNHAVKVSEDLRHAIKDSIEIIGNDVLTRRREQDITTPIDGQDLAQQSLRYLYRILFLLFAEASPELNILPTGVADYDEGYGLTHLRNQILVEPPTDRAARGTYLYDSLNILFTLVDQGHDPLDPDLPLHDAHAHTDGLQFRNLSADLFADAAIAHISEVKLSNAALHRVLQNLLLTREKPGRERGFVSYATLGVTQLGQVYEGLMSYKGVIADRELIEVAPHGDPSKGSWVVPTALAETLPSDSFVQVAVGNDATGMRTVNRRYKTGSFVYRQSSRDRERSASFYSPPVITSFTVGQAIEELRANGRISEADDILTLSICEPAMGSGAFAVEAVNQLAELYLQLKQEELGQQIPAEDLPAELQKVKASIALHQVYGVDLNSTAVELAEISLWLSTMTADLKAPWFGLRLRHGNSLIGASRSTVPASELTKKAYLNERPRHHSMTSVVEAIESMQPDPDMEGRVHHFLLPSRGWGSAVESKDLKGFALLERHALMEWRKSVLRGFTKTQRKTLLKLSRRVEVLWRMALVRVQIAEDQVRRDISLWGQDATESGERQIVTRAQVEDELFHNQNRAYQRLRLVMNAWNALWFWPITEVDALPSKDEWLDFLGAALGEENPAMRPDKAGSEGFGFRMQWYELDFMEDLDFQSSGAKTYEKLLEAHPWLTIVEEVSKDQAFFHWDLDFAGPMSQGGFDLQVGNPPWVRPDVDLDALLAEHDPWFKLAHKPTQAAKRERFDELADDPEVLRSLSRGILDSVVVAVILRDTNRYPHLYNQRPDLYRAFMERTWANNSADGIISLVHPESHLTEKNAATLRAGAYRRLRRHWQFINELRLFEVHNLVTYGIHVYGQSQSKPLFLSATSAYHPNTIMESLRHDGSGALPGFKDDNNHWDLRPHKDRISIINKDTLETWKSIIEDANTPLLETRMVYTVNTEAASVLAKLADLQRVKVLGLQYSDGWNETTDKKRGYFDSSWQHPTKWEDAILQGPHLGISNPMAKEPNPTIKSNKDWSEIDLEALAVDYVPATAYRRNHGATDYITAYGEWTDLQEEPISPTEYYRLAWRCMAASTGFRTLYPAIVPPGSTHVDGIVSAGPIHNMKVVTTGAFLSSLLVDFMVRATGKSHLRGPLIETLPIGEPNLLWSIAARRYLELNCLTTAYAPLWEELIGEEWTPETPLRVARDRWHAQNEIDAIVAISLGITADELCMIYRTYFPVMRRYDREHLYDANGRKVPKDLLKALKNVKEGEELSAAERTLTHPQSGAEYTYELPFAPLDREADLRAAYQRYSQMAEQ